MKRKQTIGVLKNVYNLGECAQEKIICDNILIGYAPKTYSNDGQPAKRNIQITREWAMTCFSYTHILRYLQRVPTTGNERGGTIWGRELLDGHPS